MDRDLDFAEIFSEYATTSCGQRVAGSGDVRNRFLELAPSPSLYLCTPPPPPDHSSGPGWKSVCNPFVTRNISFLTAAAADILGPGHGGNICKDS